MKIKASFEKKIILSAVIITFIPLIVSYSIFIGDRLNYIDKRIRLNLKETAFSISDDKFIQEKLYNRQNDYSIQEYSKRIINNKEDVDIIVVADMTGKKYSHLDESQIGQIFVNEDKIKVLTSGEGYYSLMVGSVGKTLRRFEPIMYNGKQVGFVMVGKYYDDINIINMNTKIRYIILFILTFSIAIITSKIFAKKIKKAILGMEPEEIARLYKEKDIIINSVNDGIIALNSKNEVMEINKNCYIIFENFNVEKVIDKLRPYINYKKILEMKEVIILNKKIFVTLQPIYANDNYIGVVITLIDKNNIRRIAKEITGVDEVVKNLRATVHENKNNLHVILGLINLKEYGEAKKFILKVQGIQQHSTAKFSAVEDYYVRALLLSRELVAKERNVEFILTEGSFLFGKHGQIDSYDIVTILGNLIENAFEACSMINNKGSKVEITLWEDSNKVELQVRDNGLDISDNLKKKIFELGVSSKGEGRGTGLYLVKNRVELYDGEIEIEEFQGEKIFVITILK